jgi:hypothetical protein
MLYWFADDYTLDYFKTTLGNWTAFLVPVGFVLLIAGIYYLYAFIRDRKFVLEELQTNKRSEFIKKHLELKTTVKRLPKKYRDMVKDKEKELKIR